MTTKKLTQMSLLTAVALILYIVELRLPAPVPIPGAKLGLANIVTVVSLYRFSAKEAGMILGVRIILGTIFAGSMSALLFSVSGAVFCFAGMVILCRILIKKYVWLASVFGAMLHNAGQVGAAVWITKSWGVLAYFPILTVTGCIAGLFTGLCAQFVLFRLPRC